jgi:hypothetical protein
MRSGIVIIDIMCYKIHIIKALGDSKQDDYLIRTYLKIADFQIFRHTREGGYPEKAKKTGFPFARERNKTKDWKEISAITSEKKNLRRIIMGWQYRDKRWSLPI